MPLNTEQEFRQQVLIRNSRGHDALEAMTATLTLANGCHGYEQDFT